MSVDISFLSLSFIKLSLFLSEQTILRTSCSHVDGIFIACIGIQTNYTNRAVPYPELFWSRIPVVWDAKLVSNPQTLKSVDFWMVWSFCQRSLSQREPRAESNVLSYSECKIAKNFPCPCWGPQWGGLTALPRTPWLHNSWFFLSPVQIARIWKWNQNIWRKVTFT